MQLILDFGNTFLKVFVFEGQSLIVETRAKGTHWETTIKQIRTRYPEIMSVMISDVRGMEAVHERPALHNLKYFYCNNSLKLPFQNNYKAPQQLGADRIGLVAAACLLYPKQDVLIVDLGTCITYDFKDHREHYYGGAISPGFEMRYRSLHEQTGKLPHLQPQEPFDAIGATTEDSIHIGVYTGIFAEIQWQIEQFKNKSDKLTVIFSGGDAQRLSKRFNFGIFAHSEFLAIGLNYLLELNKTEC